MQSFHNLLCNYFWEIKVKPVPSPCYSYIDSMQKLFHIITFIILSDIDTNFIKFRGPMRLSVFLCALPSCIIGSWAPQ